MKEYLRCCRECARYFVAGQTVTETERTVIVRQIRLYRVFRRGSNLEH